MKPVVLKCRGMNGAVNALRRAAIVLCCAAALPAISTGVEKTLTAKTYAALYDEVCGVVEQNFYDPAVIAGRFPDIRKRYRRRAAGARSEKEFSSAVNAMLSELKASHTRYYTGDDQEYYQLRSIFSTMPVMKDLPARCPSIGILTERKDGRIFVRGVLEGGAAEKAGLLKGDEIVSADGKPFEPVRSLEGKAGADVVLKIRRSPGHPLAEVHVAPEMADPKEEFLRAERESIRVIDAGGKKVGYIHVWCYAGEQYQQELLDAIAWGKLKDADALVLDLRDGWGGANPDYLNMFNRRVPVMTSTDREGKATVYDPQWRKPVVLLVNGGVKSGKEILAWGFRKYGIGKIVGERTAGAVLAGRPFVLSDGALLYLAGLAVKVDGEVLEGAGVAPDVAVPLKLEYCAGKDAQVEAAVDQAAALQGKDR